MQWMIDEIRRQFEELAASLVDDRDIVAFRNQHDTLVHMLKRELELFRFLLRTRFAAENLLHGGKNDQGEEHPRERIPLQALQGRLQDVAFAHPDGRPQRIAAHLTQRHHHRLRILRVREFEERMAAVVEMMMLRRPGQILAQSKASGRAAAARPDHAVTPYHGDRGRRAEIDLVVEVGKMLRIERDDNYTAEGAVTVGETPRELHRPLTAGATDNGFADE